MGLISSPGRPGASPDRPLWTAEAKTGSDKATGIIDLAAKVLMFGYALLTAWEIAKEINPELQLRQDLAIEVLRRKLTRTPALLPEFPARDLRALYDDTR